jgi:acyl-CoA synthetase (AMP-forming)/AMP-acid ligase II
MLFGSPALVERLATHGAETGARLDGIKRVLSAGAPVRPQVVAQLQAMLGAQAEVWTPYGATECLPVAVIEGREIVGSARSGTDAGAGICVGRPLAANTVRVIRTSDDAIASWDDAFELPAGRIGEITVAGPSATERYFRRDRATALAKIAERDPQTGVARTVHRMGDLGYFDDSGRLWYVGRNRTASKPPRARCTRSRSRACSTRTPTSGAARSSASARRGSSDRCCASSCARVARVRPGSASRTSSSRWAPRTS